MPRRFATLINAISARPSSTRCSASDVELRDRDDGGDARGDRHRDGEDVVDEQRRAGHERRVLAEVLAAHHVAAATARVGEDRLAVRRDDDRQEDRHRDPDRDQRVESEGEARGADRDDEEDLLGGVGGGRDGVGGEGRERDRLRDPLVLHLGRGQGTADQDPLDERHAALPPGALARPVRRQHAKWRRAKSRFERASEPR